MNVLVQALTELKNESKKTKKQEILKEIEKIPMVRETLHFLLNSEITTGISEGKLEKVYNMNTSDCESLTWLELLEYIKTNNTGRDVDLKMVQKFVKEHPNQASFIYDVITKSFTVGVSPKSINKAYGKGFVPYFEVQRGLNYAEKFESHAPGTKHAVTQKLDGYRALPIIKRTGDNVTIDVKSRNGKSIENISELKAQLKNFVLQNKTLFHQFPNGYVLDGELLAKTNGETLSSDEIYQKTSKILQTKGEKTGLVYHIFDIVDYAEFFNNDESSQVYRERRSIIDQLNLRLVADIVVTPVIKWVNTMAEVNELVETMDPNWEGFMLNAENGTYQKKKTANLLKVKQMATADLEIVGFEQAKSGKHKGILKSLIVKLDEDNLINVGSGVSDDMKHEIWHNQEKYLGKVAEIQYFEQTKNQKGGKSLRFPVFKQMRFDKTVDDVSLF